jgi:hypothetical protein
MCYLIAKRLNDKGCLSVKVERSRALASLVSYLSLKTLDKGIEVLTVSNREIWGEYAPYTSIDSEAEFVQRVLAM